VDAACIGGVRLDYDGKRVDGTVSNRLEKLGSLLKNTVL
jgi:F0F1-type ATP synthase delta subunit